MGEIPQPTMKRQRQLYLIIGILSFHFSFSQNSLEGSVLDAMTRRPVAFAYVTIKNKSLGTATNAEGYFKFQNGHPAPEDTLLITHINYLSIGINVLDYLKGNDNTILLHENPISLQEVEIKAQEDDHLLDEIINQSKRLLGLPVTAHLYYRELVKENKSYNKFADALLNVSFEKEDINIKVNQCRVIQLPKEEDDAFELISPVKMDLVLGYEYINFLNRFRKEQKKDYHFYAQEGGMLNDYYLLRIEPKKEASREKDKLLYYATIKADRDKNITEVELTLDSLCHYEKSILGLALQIEKAHTKLNFKRAGDLYYLSYVRLDYGMKFTTKKINQKENFISEFLVIDAMPGAQLIEKKDRYKKSSLYKHGTQYDRPFWKEVNLPVLTKDEELLLSQLENAQKEKK